MADEASERASKLMGIIRDKLGNLLEQVLTESPTLEGVSATVQAKLLSVAPGVFAL